MATPESIDISRIRRADFPQQTQLQGMAAQADTWLLAQIELNEMTPYEALAIVSHMLQTVTTLIRRDDATHALAHTRKGRR